MTHPSNDPVSTTKDPSNAKMDAFIKRASTERIVYKPTFTLTHEEFDQRVRIIGLFFGGLSSVLMGILPQIVNQVMLPGIPLSYAPFGFTGNLFLILIIGMILGLVSVVSLKAQDRLIKLIMVFAMILIIGALVKLGNVFAVVFLGTAWFLFLLGIVMALVLLLLPFGLLLRWAAHGQVKYFDKPWWYWKRSLRAMLFVGLILGVGLLFIYTPKERRALYTMNLVLGQAQTAHTYNSLPGVIQRMNGAPFIPYAQGGYVLLPQHYPEIPGQVNLDGTPFFQDITIGARFDSGYTLVCKFTSTGTLYNCSTDWQPPLDNMNG